jgi:hypothetical protein
MSETTQGPEELCKELLGLVERLYDEKAPFTKIASETAKFIKEKRIRINIIQKKGARPQAVEPTWHNVTSVGACNQLKEILENGETEAKDRLAAIVHLIKGSANTTRRNGAKNNVSQKAPRTAVAFNAADPQNGSLETLNAMIGAQLGAEYNESIEGSERLTGGAEEDIFTCDAFEISLQCLHADGTNSDCFIHSFLLATCPNFRAAKVAGKPYRAFATKFRTTIVPLIVAHEFATNPDFQGKVHTSKNGKQEPLETLLKRELAAPGGFLDDALIRVICAYYKICIIVIGPGDPRVARLLYFSQKKEVVDVYHPAYVISNNEGVHWEPVRVIETGAYLLDKDQAQCIIEAYAGQPEDNENTKERERAFEQLDVIKGIQGASVPEEAKKALLASFLSNETDASGKPYAKNEAGQSVDDKGVLIDNAPDPDGERGKAKGQVTQLYLEKDAVIMGLEALKDQIKANYRKHGLGYQEEYEQLQEESDEITEDLKDDQIREANQDPDDLPSLEDMTAKVNAFIAKVEAIMNPVPTARKGKVKPKKAKGGFQTRRKLRARL